MLPLAVATTSALIWALLPTAPPQSAQRGTPQAFQVPPRAPTITEPPVDGHVVNAADTHMETGPMNDPDPTDAHVSSDFEIWTVSPPARVWASLGVTGVEKVHTHLGDGQFGGSHAGFSQLAYATSYRLRVRHRDSGQNWSPWSERFFQTAPQTQILPLELDDIEDTPLPTWRDELGVDLELPAPAPPAPPASVRVENNVGGLLLGLSGDAAPGDLLVNPPGLALHAPTRVVLDGGSTGFATPPSALAFTDHDGDDVVLWLPGVNLAAQEVALLWVSANGSTYWGVPGQTVPDFSTLAAGAPVPWDVEQPGYRVEVVTTGLQLPVNIAFPPTNNGAPTEPRFYVTELYGAIKVVTNDGSVSDYASGLLNFNPTGNFPGTGELGLAGLCIDPISGDLFAGMLYVPVPGMPVLYPRIVRFHSTDGGLTASSQTTILDMVGEMQGQSHFISNMTIGPDGRLYVHMGDGFDASTALDLDSFRGKVLRLRLNGLAPPDNPFYDASDGIGARDYVYAYGLRNPFGGAWRGLDHFQVENGPGNNDRLSRIDAGTSYGWNGSPGSMLTNAIYTWNTPHAPVNIAFPQSNVFGGSGFPADKQGHAYVTESGPTYAAGTSTQGKRIVEFEIDAQGNLVSGPSSLIRYNGSGRATAAGLAAGPDGLYFTDLYDDLGSSPLDAGANVLRIRYVGVAGFTADVTSGNPPLAVQFTDASDVPGAAAWFWDFGDGTTSTQRNPRHSYTAAGDYSVRLEVLGPRGVVVDQRNAFVSVTDAGTGLTASYFDEATFDGVRLVGLDPKIDFDWGAGSPHPALDSDSFSARWEGWLEPRFGETHEFLTTTDDGVRLWVDGRLVIDRWFDQSASEAVGSLDLEAGVRVPIVLEYYERDGDAEVRLEWRSPSQEREVVPTDRLHPSGLKVEYFANPELRGAPTLTGVDVTLDHDWGDRSPDAGIPADSFSARWTARLRPDFTETYEFTTESDDGVRLWIDGELVIDQWADQPPTRHSGSVPLVAGREVTLTCEYYENQGVAAARLEWQSPSVAREVVPATSLRPVQ